ncbi:MAG: hypothetical protein M3512_10095 [Bacteroidota bacterium]|nr:hypothetical protein [Bacteroidota bacterium]
MTYILGIDQGLSHTRAAICNSLGEIINVGFAKGACHSSSGMDLAMQRIKAAAEQAVTGGSIQKEQISLMYCGISGADWPDEYDLLKSNLLELNISRNVVVKNDSIIAFRGGTFKKFGAVVIAGSGGNCAIISPDATEFVYHYYHDQSLQGGIALGRAACQMIYKSETHRLPETKLKSEVLQFFGFNNVDELLRADVEGKISIEEIKNISPFIFDAAFEGDRVACMIIKEFGKGLAELVTAGLENFKMLNMAVDVVISGSVFKGKGELLSEVFASEVHFKAPKANIINARFEPVIGALLGGLLDNSIELCECVIKNIESGARKFNLLRL